MKKILAIVIVLSVTLTIKSQEYTKEGWTFGVLPSVSFDADLGLQYGALTNIYYYGDGSTYPEYLHSIYAEASYTTKRKGTFRLSYDSKYLIPRHRLSIDLTYLPDMMSDFYGYNGYSTQLNRSYCEQDSADYITRAYYKHRSDLLRFCADISGDITSGLKWNAGVGMLKFDIGSIDIGRLNKNKDEADMLPDTTTLYDYYVLMGYIPTAEATGGTHPYVHGGITYDTRDRQTNPRRGIHADAFITYYAGLGDMKDYNDFKININWRQYVPLMPERATLAYRVGTQLNLAGKSPFYLNTYLNQLYYQRASYEGLGGGNSVRGMLRHRVLAKGVAFSNVELRVHLFKFMIGKNMLTLGINPFIDAGMVVQPYDDVVADPHKSYDTWSSDASDESIYDDSRLHNIHFTGGCGLKAALNTNFVVSVDWARAFDKQDNYKTSNLYIKIGYMF